MPDFHPSSQKTLRQVVSQGSIQVPGAFNPITARLIERSGFSACYLSGAAFSASALALPDIGLFTLTELTEHTKRIATAVAIPIIVDADTGFGETVNVERTVVELSMAGAAAIQLEDQQLPKRCGHLSGKTLVEVDAMCDKIRAAAMARPVADLVIIARTDARGVTGLDDAISRARSYLKAGADWIFPEALIDRAEFQRFAAEINAPLVANMTEFGKSPLIPFQELADLGYAVVLYPVTLLRTAMKALENALRIIRDSGSQAELIGQMQTRQELYDLLDYGLFEKRDQAHFGGRDAGS